MVAGHLPAVVVVGPGTDVQEHVVARGCRRHDHAVVVQVGGLRGVDLDVGLADVVDQLELEPVAALHLQYRRDVLAVEDVGAEALASHGHQRRGLPQRHLQHAVAAVHDVGLGNVWPEAIVVAGGQRDHRRQHAAQRHQAPEIARNTHRPILL
jgi:hypothetical protein